MHMRACLIKVDHCICNLKIRQIFLQFQKELLIDLFHKYFVTAVLFPKFFIPTLYDDLHRHVLFRFGHMFKIIANPSFRSCLLCIVFMQGSVKLSTVNIFHVLHEIGCPIKKCDVIPAVILRMVFPQIVFCYSGEFCLAVDCAFLVADVVAERNLSHVFLPDFTLKQCGYHLGSAIDDNPLAVLSKSMFHCLRQYCGGSPRVSSEMCFQHIGNNFPAVLCLFY